MKSIYHYLTLILALLIMLTYCGNGNNGVTIVGKPNRVADDGSWVYIIDNKKINKEEFELTYQLFLKMVAISSGMGQEQIGLISRKIVKKDVLEKLINSELAFQKAMTDPFFKEEQGKNLILAYRKQALYQYYLYKEIMSKVKEPTQKELEAFVKKYARSFKTADGLPKLKTQKEINQVKRFYKENQLRKKVRQMMTKLTQENRIIRNKKPILQDYLAKKITKKMLADDKQGQYWLFKINDKPVHLRSAIHLVDLQLKNLRVGNKLKTHQGRTQIANALLEGYKGMELGYRASLEKGYHNQPEGKMFISLVQKRSIAIYYLMTKVLSKVKTVGDDVVKKVLKDKAKKKLVIRHLKSRKIPVNNKNIKQVVRQQLYSEHMKAAQSNFVKELKETHQIRISDKYFETEADKIQKEILKDKKE